MVGEMPKYPYILYGNYIFLYPCAILKEKTA